jgi:hypothetical protein
MKQFLMLLLTSLTISCFAAEPEKDCGGPADPCHQCKAHPQQPDHIDIENHQPPCWQLVELLSARTINYDIVTGQEREDLKKDIVATIYFADCVERQAAIKDLLKDRKVKGQLRATLTYLDDTIDEQNGECTFQAALDRYEQRHRASTLRATKRKPRNHSRSRL